MSLKRLKTWKLLTSATMFLRKCWILVARNVRWSVLNFVSCLSREPRSRRDGAAPLQETQQSVRDAMEAQPLQELSAYLIGTDTTGATYIHLPQFCGADLRIYRQSAVAPPSVRRQQTEWQRMTEAEPPVVVVVAKTVSESRRGDSRPLCTNYPRVNHSKR